MSSEDSRRESNALRASVLDAALQLGLAANGGVAQWMFSHAVVEEDEDEAPSPGLTYGSLSEESHPHSAPDVVQSINQFVHDQFVDIPDSVDAPPPLATPNKPQRKLRKKKTGDGYESDGGYISDHAKKSKKKDADNDSESKKAEKKRLKDEKRDEKARAKSDKKEAKKAKKDGCETDDGYMSSASRRKFFRLGGRNQSKPDVADEPVPPVPPVLPPMPLPIAEHFAATFGASKPGIVRIRAEPMPRAISPSILRPASPATARSPSPFTPTRSPSPHTLPSPHPPLSASSNPSRIARLRLDTLAASELTSPSPLPQPGRARSLHHDIPPPSPPPVSPLPAPPGPATPQRGKAPPFPIKPPSSSRVSNSPGLEARIKVRRYRDLYGLPTPPGGWQTAEPPSPLPLPRAHHRPGIHIEQPSDGEEDDVDSYVAVGTAIPRSRSLDTMHQPADDDDASLYPDEDRTAGRLTMYQVEHGHRWSASEYPAARTSFIDDDKSHALREAFVRNVEASYDTSSGREKMPPAPRIPPGAKQGWF